MKRGRQAGPHLIGPWRPHKSLDDSSGAMGSIRGA